MRLTILDSGHGFWSKVLFTIIRLVSRQSYDRKLWMNG